MKTRTLTVQDARRLAIASQRLAKPLAPATKAGMFDVIQSLGCVQLDPVKTVERTQYLVLWSRLGNYSRNLLDRLLFEDRVLYEYWAHCASIVLTENRPIHEIQYRYYRQSTRKSTQRLRDWVEANAEFRQYVKQMLHEKGPLLAKEIEDRSSTPWISSGWTNTRRVNRSVLTMLTYLWDCGEVVVGGRDGLKKSWALAEDWFTPENLNQPFDEGALVLDAAEISLKALGVGTPKHIQNHFIRGYYGDVAAITEKLVEMGKVVPVTIDADWAGDWFVHVDQLPLLDAIQAGEWRTRTVLLSPFDNLICNRDRTELMWDFYFRIEIYVPVAKRQYGFYVLPILHGDQLIGRISPKMDRKTGILHIEAVYAEPKAPKNKRVRKAIATQIKALAKFLGATQIQFDSTKQQDWELEALTAI